MVIAPFLTSILEKTTSPGYAANMEPLNGSVRSRGSIVPSK